ncbi:MAG: hypothetical protein U1E67_11505 [Hyphomicrobiales bacterium]
MPMTSTPLPGINGGLDMASIAGATLEGAARSCERRDWRLPSVISGTADCDRRAAGDIDPLIGPDSPRGLVRLLQKALNEKNYDCGAETASSGRSRERPSWRSGPMRDSTHQ